MKKRFAPGLPSKKDKGNLDAVNPGTLLDYVRQKHKARRAGEHFDWRMGNKKLGLISWATKKDYPKPGKPIKLFRQPVHSYDYKDFEGEIEEGYGKGSVEIADKGKVLITKKDKGKTSFTTAHEQVPKRYAILHDKEDMMVRAKDPEVKTGLKPRMKNVPTKRVSVYVRKLGDKDRVQPKIDGSLSLIQLLKNKDVEILSHRTSKRTHKPIYHTERFFGSRPNIKALPKEFLDAVVLGETYGTQKGKVIPQQELGGLLNSTIANSLEAQRDKDIKLKTMLFDIAQKQGKPDTDPYPKRLEDLRKLIKYLPNSGKFHLPETVLGSEASTKLLEQIQAGKHPLTTEGVVIRKEDGSTLKAKLMEEHDVYVREIVPGRNKYKGIGAGAFRYSLTPNGPVVGKVGTGLSDELRKAMNTNPEEFLKRVARIKTQGQFLASGAYRAPALIALHESH